MQGLPTPRAELVALLVLRSTIWAEHDTLLLLTQNKVYGREQSDCCDRPAIKEEGLDGIPILVPERFYELAVTAGDRQRDHEHGHANHCSNHDPARGTQFRLLLIRVYLRIWSNMADYSASRN